MTLARDEIEGLLPFYVNQTLDADEQARVAAAVADDPALQSDLEALKYLRATMQADEDDLSPGQFAFARLMRDIEREQPARPATAVLPWGIAAAAVVGMLAVGLLWMAEPSDAPFVQASGDAQTVGLTVAFRADAPQSAVSALLLELDATVVGGPSALGLYTVAPASGVDPGTLAEALRAQPDLVESVDLP